MRLRIDILLYCELLTECPYTIDPMVYIFDQWLKQTWTAICTRPSSSDSDPLLGWELVFDDPYKLTLFELKYSTYNIEIVK